MPTTAEKLWIATQNLPEPLLAEVLDFAQFMQLKHQKQQCNLPEKTSAHAPLSLADLQGGLESSTAFAGDLVALQQRLRDEWH